MNRIARNTIWNLMGQGIPLVSAFIAMPFLMRGLGSARFGLLAISWMVVGYFSFFDMGLGRALTKHVADSLGAGRHEEIPSLAWTGLASAFMLGAAGAVIIAAGTPFLTGHFLKMPASLKNEAAHLFYLLALATPVVVCSTGLRGILEAYRRFDAINMAAIPMGIFTYLGPLAALVVSKSLFLIALVMIAGRAIMAIVFFILCMGSIPAMKDGIQFERAHLKKLFGYGGWITVSNIVGPLMTYLDRFLIGSIASVALVSYYTAPYELITKLSIVSGALCAVLFPAFAEISASDRKGATGLFFKSVKFVFSIQFPIILLAVAFAREGLGLWMGAEFAGKSEFVAQCLAFGVFFNCLAMIPFALAQGMGRPDLTAKLHLAELPLYLAGAAFLIKEYGINGAALAWTARVVVDAFVLFLISFGFLREEKGQAGRLVIAFSAAAGIFIASSMVDSLAHKAIFAAVATPTLFAFAWMLVFTEDERIFARDRIKTATARLKAGPG